MTNKAHSAKWSDESKGRQRLREEFPWLDRYLSQFQEPLMQDVHFRLLLPFAESKEYQNDFLLHLIVFTQKERSIDPSYSGYLHQLISHAIDNNDSDFTQALAERLRFLKELPGRHATEREEAIVALQLAVLAEGEHNGKRDLPTKSEITKIAIEILARRTASKNRPSENDSDEPPIRFDSLKEARKHFAGKSRGLWNRWREAAGLSTLPNAKPGRPSKAELDEDKKARREVMAIVTQAANERYRGNWLLLRSRIRSAYGTKTEALADQPHFQPDHLSGGMFSDEP